MAVQIPDPGQGDNKTGDNEYVFRKKVRDNFSDQRNAASRLVGYQSNQIPLAQDVNRAAAVSIPEITSGIDINALDLDREYRFYGATANAPLHSSNTLYLKSKIVYEISTRKTWQQVLWGEDLGDTWTRKVNKDLLTGEFVFSDWRAITRNQATYLKTTAAGANVVVTPSGELQRSTSSERYKDILADLELDDEAYQNAMQLSPIVYRSTAAADNPDYHYYSFSAEALGAFDPALTLWRDTETVTDADGNVTEQPLDERVAEGININALLAFSHAIAIKQDKMIKAQAEAIETLTQRIDAMTAQ